jgi:hypothetical protein
MQKEQSNVQDQTATTPQASRPINESGSVNVSGYVRVFDPNTQEILVEARE